MSIPLRAGRFARVAVIAVMAMTLPVFAYAQEATLNGTVTDSTGGVLPGVTVTATHQASGNTFVAVTDTLGKYRIPLRIGAYTVTIELAGFTTVTRSGVELLLNQQAIVNLQMAPSALQETVTVTGEAPLVDVSNSRMGGNMDARQLQDLPVNGRNWLALTLLAPGNRVNSVTETPTSGQFQINVDGQQVTQIISFSFGQAKFSQDAIAEFEFASSRFDATQGRSSGVQVNAITKSGSNAPSGSFSSYFRHDKFNAPEFLTGTVLPYQNQQISTTFGGPIRRDRIHFFANYELEREPQTYQFETPYPTFNITFKGGKTDNKGGVRLDFQFSPQTHLTLRGAKYHNTSYCEPGECSGSTSGPSRALEATRDQNDLHVTLSQVLNSRMVNEIKGGYGGFNWWRRSLVNYPANPVPRANKRGAPLITFRGFQYGQNHQNSPQHLVQDPYSISDNLTLSFTGRGRHDVKTGGEYIDFKKSVFVCNRCFGTLDAQGGPVPANIEALFPVWNDVSTWNMAALTPIARRFQQAVGQFNSYVPRHVFAFWAQDDWKPTSRLTLNLGLRYDLSINTFGERVAVPPFLGANRPDDTNNFGPRLGFGYSLNDKTVLRGGVGKYFGETTDQPAIFDYLYAQIVGIDLLPDGRPDWAGNPYNGPVPTAEQARAKGYPQSLSGIPGPSNTIAYSWQASIGLQRQIASDTAFEADYVFTGDRDTTGGRDINVAFNPSTGAQYPQSDVTKRPYTTIGFGSVSMTYDQSAENNYHGLQTSLTKRFSHRWQASANYLLSLQWEREGKPVNPGCQYPMTIAASGAFVCNVPFTYAVDIAPEYFLGGAQRHRATFNGIWEVGYGVQVSGLYFFGDQGKATPTSGVDVRGTGSPGRLRANGTIISRNSFDNDAIQRVDMKVQRRFKLAGRSTLEGSFEMFNVFNRANFASWTTNEASALYGKPQTSTNISYKPRMLQFGLRATF